MLQWVCPFFFFFFTKNSDIAFKIFESHAEEYCIVGNCAGIRWLTLLICNNIMLHMSSSHFTWITWLKSTELLWFSAVLKQVSAKAKRPIDLFFFFFFSLGMLNQFFCFFGTLQYRKWIEMSGQWKKQHRKRIFMNWWAESWAGSSRVGSVSGQIPYAGSPHFLAVFKTDGSCYTSQRKPGTSQLVVKETCTITRHQLRSPDTQSPDN